MSDLTADLFINEKTSPRVCTVTDQSGTSWEVIHFGPLPGQVFTLYTFGGPEKALDYWDRLRRACVEAIDRTQRRLDAQPKEEG